MIFVVKLHVHSFDLFEYRVPAVWYGAFLKHAESWVNKSQSINPSLVNINKITNGIWIGSLFFWPLWFLVIMWHPELWFNTLMIQGMGVGWTRTMSFGSRIEHRVMTWNGTVWCYDKFVSSEMGISSFNSHLSFIYSLLLSPSLFSSAIFPFFSPYNYYIISYPLFSLPTYLPFFRVQFMQSQYEVFSISLCTPEILVFLDQPQYFLQRFPRKVHAGVGLELELYTVLYQL